MTYALAILLALMAPTSAAEDGYSASHFLPGCKTAASKPDARNEINIRAAYCALASWGLGTTSACIPSDVSDASSPTTLRPARTGSTRDSAFSRWRIGS